MGDFTETLNDSNPLKDKLFEALNRRKPFREFKFVIDNSGKYRQVLFDFKNQWLKDLVRNCIKSIENIDK
jgi:hypothetical protein